MIPNCRGKYSPTISRYEHASLPTPTLNRKLFSRIIGIFESRPPLPRYSSTWNVKNVFNYIRSQDDVSLLTLSGISVSSGQRYQTISKLSLDNMIIDENKITFVITEKLKHTRPGAHQKPLIYLAYASDKKL